ncbi:MULTISPECIES: LysR substrate-binding domain-containing protein [Paracoccus]|uniref:LysR family transcriptional regulator n=1 Tax=Paracoccus onubensis TaxID=1675788 RepID=A0A418SYI9_9RHOB|nr:LysR substrate-binding domain-containing protein [Paracoccus onubensis]MDP0926046.1 LysR substrate-binding domain-containing protein [Paracoccus onubensis]RJE85990.1 LysR family transcriptional regulator [Paracoccus onubensis]
MHQLTLRQIEVIRAVMLTGTISGAARMLNVSAPGISRLVKHTEEALGLRLFERRGGVYLPAVEAGSIFDQIGRVFGNVENLNRAVASLQRGEAVDLSFASAPSVAQFIAARAARSIRQRYPDLFIDLNILKIEETIDYLMLERGEFVLMSTSVENAGISNEIAARGRLAAIVPEDHPLAASVRVSIHDLAKYPMIGVDPEDPYGRVCATPLRDAGLPVRYSMRGRFAQTVVSLVRHGLGVAVIDEFSVAELYMPGVVRLSLIEETPITIYIVTKAGRVLSGFAEYAIQQLRRELSRATESRPWEQRKAR